MQKAQESVSVAVLPFEASRIALLMSDGNAEAHARICNTRPDISLPRYHTGGRVLHNLGHLPLLNP